jgi:hypothetical protein
MRRGSMAKERATPAAEKESPQTSAEPRCVHHWVIETPSGTTSWGVCKICGDKREFQNYASDFIWEGDSIDSLQQGGWRKPVTELIRPPGEEKDESSFASGDTTGAAPEKRFF